MNLLQLTKKNEMALLITSLTALLFAFGVKNLELEEQNIAIFLLLVTFLAMNTYIIAISILEKDKFVKWTLIVYSAYLFSVICKLLSYTLSSFFDLQRIFRLLANLLGLLHSPATLLLAISLIYLMRAQKTLIKTLFALTALLLILNLAKGILSIDHFLNSIELNENVLLFVATLTLGFSFSSINKIESIGLKGIMTILFFNSVYVLIKSFHQYL